MEIGRSFTSTLIVDNSQTAMQLGSGDLPVFATPALIALMENAAMMTVQDALLAEKTTVGVSVSVKHTKATPLGATVKAKATLVGSDGAKLTFRVEAWDEVGEIGHGEHVRYIVDRESFMDRIK